MNTLVNFRRLTTAFLAAIVATPILAIAAPAQALSVVACESKITLDQAEDQPHDPDGETTGLVALLGKKVKFQMTVEHTNCLGDPAVQSGKGKGFVMFTGTCVSALAPASGSTDWFDAQGKKAGTSNWTANLEMVTTGTEGDAVTTVVTTGRVVSGRYANAAAAAPRTAVDGTGLSCLGPDPQPITVVEADGAHSVVGL